MKFEFMEINFAVALPSLRFLRVPKARKPEDEQRKTRYLGRRRKRTLTETVRCFEEYGPDLMPLPHPSWRSRLWIKKNPWFVDQVLPVLRARVDSIRDLSD